MEGPGDAPPSRSRRTHWILFAALAAGICVLDLWTKEAVFRLLKVEIGPDPDGGVRVLRSEKVVIIPNFFELEANINFGAFSGWFAEHTLVLTLLSLLALGAILWFLWSSLRGPGPHRLWVTAGLGLLWGGTLGNLYDRAVHGYVRDFIKWFVVVNGRPRVWPNFNIADSAICVGVGIILISSFLRPAGKKGP